jgi:c-di-GMP-binding flagellar brake protein YcgR
MENYSNRRRYPRFKAPICYRSASFFAPRKPLVNIGLGGIRIYSNDKLKIGKRLEIELLLPEDEVLEFTAKVVWQQELPEDESARYDVGLQFLDVPADKLERLSHILENYTELSDEEE